MIFIKENENVIGYVAFFERDFLDLEIKRFIKTSAGGIESKIVKFILNVQGIYTSKYNWMEDIFCQISPPDTLADVTFEFDTLLETTRYVQLEEDEILNAFILLQNAKFYKIEYSSKLSDNEKEVAARNEIALKELQEVFNKNKIPLDISKLFVDETEQSIIDKAYANRRFTPKDFNC